MELLSSLLDAGLDLIKVVSQFMHQFRKNSYAGTQDSCRFAYFSYSTSPKLKATVTFVRVGTEEYLHQNQAAAPRSLCLNPGRIDLYVYVDVIRKRRR